MAAGIHQIFVGLSLIHQLPSKHRIGNLACMKNSRYSSFKTLHGCSFAEVRLSPVFSSCSWPNAPSSVALQAGMPATFAEKKYYAAASGSIMTMSAS